MSRGIDIHPYYQRSVSNWAAVKKAVSWVYVKASDGNSAYTKTVDGVTYRPDAHVRGAKGAGLPVGAYHYAQFGDPVRQANVLIAEHHRLATTLPPMLDLEAPFEPNALAKDFAIRFLRRLATAGFRPVVYMSSAFAKILRPDRWEIPGLIIWIASYSVNDGRQHALTGGYPGRVDIHQFTSKGRVAGIAGDVDLNESEITLGSAPVSPAKPAPVKSEEDELDAIEKRMLRELHAALRIGKTGVQSAGPLTLYIAETLRNTRQSLGLLAGLQKAQEQLATTGKVDLAKVAAAAEAGARAGTDAVMAELEADLTKFLHEDEETKA